MINLTHLSVISRKDSMKIRIIRNEESVRRWTFTDHIINEKEHKDWICSVVADKSRITLIVMEDEPIGIVGLTKIDEHNKRADWVYYLCEKARGRGLGIAVEFAFLDFVFNHTYIEKLNCEIIDGNKIIGIHKVFGLQHEGLRREDTIKDGKRVGVVLMGITAGEWRKSRASVYLRFEEKINNNPIRIHARHLGR